MQLQIDCETTHGHGKPNAHSGSPCCGTQSIGSGGGSPGANGGKYVQRFGLPSTHKPMISLPFVHGTVPLYGQTLPGHRTGGTGVGGRVTGAGVGAGEHGNPKPPAAAQLHSVQLHGCPFGTVQTVLHETPKTWHWLFTQVPFCAHGVTHCSSGAAAVQFCSTGVGVGGGVTHGVAAEKSIPPLHEHVSHTHV
jgi:hypothetical protein